MRSSKKKICHLGTHAVLGGFVSISVRWILLCEEVIMAEDSPQVTVQRITAC